MNNVELKPLRGGALLVLNERVLLFLQEAIEDVREVYTDEKYEKDPSRASSTLLECSGQGTTRCEWQYEKDAFGQKVYTKIPYAVPGQPGNEGELRVTVVLKKTGIFLDVRTWGTY